MNRIDRLMAIMTTLQSKKYCTGEQLSAKYHIGIRTVYRDLKALNEIGIPVHFENGKGYYIAQGYFLPPLSLTIEEANALVLLNALANKFADGSITKHGQNALNKIKAALRYSDKNKADELSSQINVYVDKNEKNETTWLSSIQNAIAGKTVLHMEYTDNEGRNSKREIEPVGLIYYTNQWHLYAWCRTKKGYRDFKVKMITRLSDTGQPHSIPQHRPIEDYIKTF
jgi:predicted DNA-binding transcriptional regulator YafY